MGLASSASSASVKSPIPNILATPIGMKEGNFCTMLQAESGNPLTKFPEKMYNSWSVSRDPSIVSETNRSEAWSCTLSIEIPNTSQALL